MKLLRYTFQSYLPKILNDKMCAFIFVMGTLSWIYAQPYAAYAGEVGYPITWCMFPFYLTSPYYLTLFYLGVIYVNSDIPFSQSSNLYQIVRTGYRKWAFAQIGGIFLRSCTLALVTAAVTILPFIGKLDVSNKWGKLTVTLAQTDSAFRQNYEAVFRIYYEALKQFSPISLMVWSLVIVSLVCTFLCLLMYLLSILVNKIVGLLAVTILSLMVYFLENTFPAYKLSVSRFLPTCWVQVAIATQQFGGFYRLPSVSYMLVWLIAATLILSALICLFINKVELKWENSDE